MKKNTNDLSYNFIWLDVIFRRVINKNIFLSVTLFVLFLFLAGLILGIIGNYLMVFLKSRVVYLALFGIWLVALSLLWGRDKFLFALKEAVECYFENNSELNNFSNKFVSIVFNNSILTLISVVFSLYICYQAVFVWFLDMHPLNKFATFPMIIENNWLEHVNTLSILTIVFYLGIAFMLLGTATFQVISSIVVVIFLARNDLKILPQLAVIKLRPLVVFYLNVSMLWFVGILIIEIVVIPKFNLASIVLTSIIVLVGIFAAFIPHVAIGISVSRAKCRTSRRILELLPEKITRINNVFQANNAINGNSYKWLEVLKEISNTKHLILDYTILIRLFGIILPIFLQIIIRSILLIE
jgi:hypothetical protein